MVARPVAVSPTTRTPAAEPSTQGTLTIEEPRGARVWINGDMLSKRVPIIDLEMDPGHYQIEIKRGEFGRTMQIDLRPGEKRVVEIKRRR